MHKSLLHSNPGAFSTYTVAASDSCTILVSIQLRRCFPGTPGRRLTHAQVSSRFELRRCFQPHRGDVWLIHNSLLYANSGDVYGFTVVTSDSCTGSSIFKLGRCFQPYHWASDSCTILFSIQAQALLPASPWQRLTHAQVSSLFKLRRLFQLHRVGV